MSNYLELKVQIRQNAEWFVKLREAMNAAHIPVKWQRRWSHHITVAFIKDDQHVDDLRDAFDRYLDECLAPALTFDRINAFVTKNDDEIILNLTSSHPSPRFVDFVSIVRQTASDLGVEMESDFKLHVTLGRIAATSTNLEDVKKVADGIQVPTFSLSLTDAEYCYFKGESICTWKMDETQPVIQISCGEVRKVKGRWLLQISKEDENIAWIGYTDHWTTDTCIVKHNGKFGIYSLIDLSDYGYFIEPPKRRCLDEDPFPYDEIRISGMDGSFYGMMAYRKGNKWGASYFYFVPAKDCVDKYDVVPCNYSTMEAALRHLPSWRNPYDQTYNLDESVETDQCYPKKDGSWDYNKINRQVMTDTKRQYESVEALKEAVNNSIRHQYMVTQDENIDQPIVEHSKTIHVCSGKRSFEAAKAYKGKKTAVLNFANNHAIGGAPFSAGAQEESLCRCSTLLPCLEAMREPFYDRHINQYMAKRIGPMGNDDLIYTPDVVVFKSDERTDPIYPKMLEQNEWYRVDVITCAAPELMRMHYRPANYEEIITSRIKKILDVAAKEQVEVLILGAWGCGAFKNPSDVVAKVFRTLLKNYNFETVEFALASRGDVSDSPFARI